MNGADSVCTRSGASITGSKVTLLKTGNEKPEWAILRGGGGKSEFIRSEVDGLESGLT